MTEKEQAREAFRAADILWAKAMSEKVPDIRKICRAKLAVKAAVDRLLVLNS
jgi:hypothetical protein